VGACSIPARLYNKARWWFNRHEWTAPAWPFSITPGEEIKAAVLAVDENIRTKASVCAEYGGDMEEVFEQRREERRKEKEYGIDPITSEIKPADQEARPAEDVEMERAAA
jgi:capsid protein